MKVLLCSRMECLNEYQAGVLALYQNIRIANFADQSKRQIINLRVADIRHNRTNSVI